MLRAFYLQEFKLRLDIERSRAIKCPTVAFQLAGCKKVQQALTEPCVLEKYLHDEIVVQQLRSTFVGQYKLDAVSKSSLIWTSHEVVVVANVLHNIFSCFRVTQSDFGEIFAFEVTNIHVFFLFSFPFLLLCMTTCM